MNQDQKTMAEEKPQCQIAGCVNPIPIDNPKDGQGEPIPLCAYHLDILKVVLWGFQHIKVQQAPQQVQQTPPKILIPGLNVPRNFNPRGN